MNTQSTTPLMSRPKEAMDTATPSGNSVALRVLVQLGHRIQSKIYLQKAEALIHAFSSDIVRSPDTFTYMMTGVSELISEESGMIQHAANGHVRAELVYPVTGKSSSEKELTVLLSIAKGWHINAEKPLQDYLIPTSVALDELTTWTLKSVQYPVPETQMLGFSKQLLALYQGPQAIKIKLKKIPSNSKEDWIQVRLRLQACSDKICLAPETLRFNLRANIPSI